MPTPFSFDRLKEWLKAIMNLSERGGSKCFNLKAQEVPKRMIVVHLPDKDQILKRAYMGLLDTTQESWCHHTCSHSWEGQNVIVLIRPLMRELLSIVIITRG